MVQRGRIDVRPRGVGRPARRPWSPIGIALAAAALTGCAATGGASDGPRLAYRGELELYLEPYDAKGLCSVTVGLRNVSGVRQEEAWLTLAWLGTDGSMVSEQRLRMDPLLPGRYSAKNLTLPVRCAAVGQAIVRDARWTVFSEVQAANPAVAAIEGASNTNWQFRWQPETGLFVGEAAPAPAAASQGS